MKVELNDNQSLRITYGDVIVDSQNRKFLIVGSGNQDDEYPVLSINLEAGYVENAFPTLESISKNISIIKHISSSSLVLTEV